MLEQGQEVVAVPLVQAVRAESRNLYPGTPLHFCVAVYQWSSGPPAGSCPGAPLLSGSTLSGGRRAGRRAGRGT